MRILFLTPQLPYPPRQGTQIRNFHLLRAAATVHQVDLLSLARPGETLEGSWDGSEGVEGTFDLTSRWDALDPTCDVPAPPRHPLLRLCWQVRLVEAPRRGLWSRLRTLATSTRPDVAERLSSHSFAATLGAIASTGGYDAIHVAGIEMARYIMTVKAASPRSAIVFDDHNAEYLLQERAARVDAHHVASWPKALYSLTQWQKLKRYETEVCNGSDTVIAVSDADAAALRRLGITTRLEVVPNGVDAGYYRPDPSIEPEPATLLFTGTMDYRPNVDAARWFVSSVFPAILAKKPDARIQIVGRSPTPSIQRLATDSQNVLVTGAVEDVRPYFSRSTLFVVPIRMAGGARLKVLEALAMGLPVVSTSMGIEGIHLEDGKEVLLADSAEDFAAAVLRLLDDPTLRKRLSLAGRQAAEERFSWSQVAPRLLGVYATIAGGRGGETTGQGDEETAVVPPQCPEEQQHDRGSVPSDTPPAGGSLAEG